MPILGSRGSGSIRSFGRFSGFKIIFWTASTTWTVPGDWSGTWNAVAIGGGGGGGGQLVAGNSGGGGGSGRKTSSLITIATGQSITVNIGGGGAGASGGNATGNGGASSLVRSGTTLITASGGNGRPTSPLANGGAGGSGGGNAANGAGSGGGLGGYRGSNGQNGTNTAGVGGAGQLGVSFGNGTDLFIPPGGAAGYRGFDATSAVWAGIFNAGAGNGGYSNTAPTARGGGGGGGTWAQVGRAGLGGIIVLYG